MYDITIVGSGPAGSTLAHLVGKKYKVLLLDKRQLEQDIKDRSLTKCCGGLVAPDAQKVLAELGLGLPQEVLVGPQIFVVRTMDLKQNLERYYQRFYINVDREKFDRWLVSLVPGNVTLGFGCSFKAVEPEKDGYRVRYICKGKEYAIHTNVLVGADGAFSKVRKLAFSGQPFPKSYIAIQEWYEAEKILPYFSAIFDDDITDFYSWTIPKGNHLLIGSAIAPGQEAESKFELLKEKLRDCGFEYGKRIKREGAFILRPDQTRHIYTGKAGIALIGEAAGWISPSSAEGLSYAFRSAIAFARSLDRGLKDAVERYEKNTASLRHNILVKNIKSPFMYNPNLRKLAMDSGIQSLKIHENY